MKVKCIRWGIWNVTIDSNLLGYVKKERSGLFMAIDKTGEWIGSRPTLPLSTNLLQHGKEA